MRTLRDRLESLPKEEVVGEVVTLAEALCDVLDGESWYDIQYNTGLTEERCKEIYEVVQKYTKEVY